MGIVGKLEKGRDGSLSRDKTKVQRKRKEESSVYLRSFSSVLFLRVFLSAQLLLSLSLQLPGDTKCMAWSLNLQHLLSQSVNLRLTYLKKEQHFLLP